MLVRRCVWMGIVVCGCAALRVITAQDAPPRKAAPDDASEVKTAKPATSIPSDPLIDVQRGTLPIIICAPHGGLEDVPGVPRRVNRPANPPPGTPRWVTGTDVNTRPLAQKIAADLERRLGGKPYFVMARFARKYIDANRAAENSYEVPAAKFYHDAYHHTIDEFCREIQKQHGAGLLVDVHGQASFKDEILVGTVGGQTVKLLIERKGREALVGREGVVGFLIDAGIKPKPVLNSEDLNVSAGLNGGYTVQTYGSHQPAGIDAVQFEYGSNYRAKENIDDAGTRTADAIEKFYRAYLAKQKAAAAPGAATQAK